MSLLTAPSDSCRAQSTGRVMRSYPNSLPHVMRRDLSKPAFSAGWLSVTWDIGSFVGNCAKSDHHRTACGAAPQARSDRNDGCHEQSPNFDPRRRRAGFCRGRYHPPVLATQWLDRWRGKLPAHTWWGRFTGSLDLQVSERTLGPWTRASYS